VSDQLHAPAALSPAKEPPVPIVTLSPRVINSFHVDTVGLVASLVPAYVCVAFLSSYLIVGCEVLTAVVMNSVFWDITPCSPFKSADVSDATHFFEMSDDF
jgi:hypothetical protein